jgi:DtxR family Mn-dependent transcriptional regulator
VGAELELREVGTQDPARLSFFAEQGLVPGTRLRVTDRQPFNGPTTVRLEGEEVRVVGRELAQALRCLAATK